MIRRHAVTWPLVVFVATTACNRPTDERVSEEVKAREAYGKSVLFAEDAGRGYGVSSTSEIMFEEGFSQISYDPQEDFRQHAFRWIGQNAHVRLKPHPGRAMKLHIQGWVNDKVLRTYPTMILYLDGEPIRTEGPIEKGHYWIDVIVEPEHLRREWVDLSIRLNAVGFHWSEPPVLMVALVYNFAWTEQP